MTSDLPRAKSKRFGCKVKVQQGKEWVTCDAAVARGVFMCPTCARNLLDDLAATPDLLDDLDFAWTRQTANGDEHTGGRSAQTPLPWDSRASRVARRFRGDVIRWVGYLTEARGDHVAGPTCAGCRHDSCRWIRAPRPRRSDARTVTGWLADQVDWMTRYRAGASFATTIAHRIDDAQHATDLPEGWRIIVGSCIETLTGPDGQRSPCPGELEAFLSDTDDPSTIRCTNRACTAEYTTQQWYRLGGRIKQATREKASA